jgi:hypothetical protein
MTCTHVRTLHSKRNVGSARQIRFLVAAGRGDHARTQTLAHLDQQLAHAARGGMNQRGLSVFQRIGAAA